VHLPGVAGSRSNTYTASHVGFEVEENGRWRELEVGYCGIPAEFAVPPGGECLVAIDLFAFRESEVSVTGRVQLAGYTSESFVLDWPTDRSQGRFHLAKKKYLAEIRTLLRRAGFRVSATEGEDFCRRFLWAILSTTQTPDSGFAPFRGDLDVIPLECPGGNLQFAFHGDCVVENDYRYVGMLVLNPSTFTPGWYRAAAQANAVIRTRGNERTLVFDDGSGFCTEANRLYFEIRYHVAAGETPPDQDASKRLLARMLSRIRDSLEEDGK
jgi:hypothetical protein